MRIKIKKFSYLLTLALSASGAMTYADTLNGNGSWQNWNASSLVANSSSSTLGTPYWNNGSGDGSSDNVGWCLVGGGNCSMPAGTPGNLPYYGNGSSAPSMLYFTSSGSPVTLTLETVMTSQTNVANGYDIFGYYVANGSGSSTSATLNPLFDSRSNSVGNSLTLSSLTAGTNYGFYIENIKGAGTPDQTSYIYLMDSASNMATGSMPADGYQHFAVFNSGNGTYFLGDKDSDACQGSFQPGTSPCVSVSQFDYNDMIVELNTGSNSTTPEPVTIALMGGGLCFIGAFLRSNKKRYLVN